MTGNAASQVAPPTFGRAIYYPYFQVQDINWLKAALLYWDEISCIVPQGYDAGNPEELKPAEGLILAVDPKPYTDCAEVAFRRSILPLVEQRDQPAGQTMLNAVVKTLGDNCAWVHANKMTGDLRYALEQRGILHRGADEQMFLDHGLDALYMICLAQEMGRATHRPPLTDAREYAQCQSLLLFAGEPVGRSLASDEQASGDTSMLVELGIAMPSPEQLANISLHNIVQYHSIRGDERRAFRQAAEAILAKTSEITDPTGLADYLNYQKRDIEKQISDYRKTLDELNLGDVESALKVSSPAWLATAGSLAGGFDTIVAGILAGLGIVVSAVAWWAKVRQARRRAVASCPWHYWMDTRRRFGRQ